jgi:hypothetical protein
MTWMDKERLRKEARRVRPEKARTFNAFWGYLDDEGTVELALEGPTPVEDIADKFEALARARERANGTEADRAIGPDARMLALADIMAIEAARLPAVQEFRSQVLRGRLLKPERIAAWMERQARKDGDPTRWEVVSPGAPDARPVASQSSFFEFLPYASPDVSQTIHKPVRAGGVLAELKGIAIALARRYSWTEELAVRFVLTGGIPLNRARYTTTSGGPYLAARMIELQVSPRLSPREVGGVFSAARRSVLGPSTRDRAITAARAELGVFGTGVNDGRSWLDAMTAWNRAHQERPYSDVRLFTRDVRQAYKRITGMDLPWIGRRREGGG